MILAKPSGISLIQHTKNVHEQAKLILETWPQLAEKYIELTGEDLESSLLNAVEWHDAGKACQGWQSACQKDYTIYTAWLKKNGKTQSAKNYKAFENNKENGAGQHLRISGFRHEFGSLLKAEQKKIEISNVERVAIAAHHGKLNKRFVNRWLSDGGGSFSQYWSRFNFQDINTYRKQPYRWERLLIERYKIAAVRALLQLADTRASRKESEGKLTPVEDYRFDYSFPHGSGNENAVQKGALELSSEECSILRAPTGSGKTDASLLWAKEVIRQGKADRLVIAMPTRFTTNALSLNVKDNFLSDTGLYHSSAWLNNSSGNENPEEKDYLREVQRMAQLLAMPVTVCTVDHLLISLTGAAEYHHSSFFFLANSAVVFDEADFYDPFVQANLTVLLTSLKILKVPVLIMSATVPDSAKELYGVDFIKEPLELDTPPIRQLSWAGKRMELDGKNYYGTQKAEDAAATLDKMLRLGHGIVYANTVERALEYYNWFKNHPDCPELIMYHSRFTESHKKVIEKKLLAMLGKEAWQNSKSKPVRGIAILTQIGEMSINISSTLMLTDLCPWDRLAQRLGRLNRFKQSDDAIAYVTVPVKNDGIYVAPYGTLEKRKWQPSEAFKGTLSSLIELLAGKERVQTTPKALVEQVNSLYPTLQEFPEKAISNQKALYDLMEQNWLIVPDRRIDEDQGTVSNKWRSRDIGEHQTVFVEPPINFDSFQEYQKFALEYGISCPTWLVEKELRKKEESRFTVVMRMVDEMETKLIWTSHYYDGSGNIETSSEKKDSAIGLAFLYENSKDKSDSSDDDW